MTEDMEKIERAVITGKKLFTDLKGKKMETPEDVLETTKIIFESVMRDIVDIFPKVGEKIEANIVNKMEGDVEVSDEFSKLLYESQTGLIDKDSDRLNELSKEVQKIDALAGVDPEDIKDYLELGIKIFGIVQFFI